MMGTRNKKLSVNRTVDAEVFIPVLRIPQPNGDVLIRAGKPEILSSADEISPTQFARRVGLSHRRVLSLIEEGLITARPLSPAAALMYGCSRSIERHASRAFTAPGG